MSTNIQQIFKDFQALFYKFKDFHGLKHIQVLYEPCVETLMLCWGGLGDRGE